MRFFSPLVLSAFAMMPIKSFLLVVRRAQFNLLPEESFSALAMMGKTRNKQAELAKKLELAKRQRLGAGNENKELTEEEIQQKNDRLRFGEMLKSGGTVSSLNEGMYGDYVSEEQEREDNRAIRSGEERKFEDDPAPTDAFEELVSVKTGNMIGKAGASRLIPWLRNDRSRQSEYLIIVTDPRQKSDEFRSTARRLFQKLSSNTRRKLIFINADTIGENRRWLKKNELDIELYADEKLNWMRSYSGLGSKRWSMSLFVIQDGRIKSIVREMDEMFADDIVLDAIKSLK